MIIGLSGLKGSGKDTVANYLVEQHGFTRKAFADKGKEAFCAYHNITLEYLEQIKNRNDAFVCLGKTSHGEFDPESTLTIREALQRFMTEAGRNVYGENHWINLVFPPQYNAEIYVGEKLVISDCRFKNECERIKYLGGAVVLIERPQPKEGYLFDEHMSEQINHNLEDYTIFNDSSILDLYDRVERMLDALLDKGFVA